MERQKLIQKIWYDHKVPPGKEEVVQISTETPIKRLKSLVPVQEVSLSFNCGWGRESQKVFLARR